MNLLHLVQRLRDLFTPPPGTCLSCPCKERNYNGEKAGMEVAGAGAGEGRVGWAACSGARAIGRAQARAHAHAW